MEYEPLSSVWEKDDAELLEKMLNFYPRQNPEIIIDTTYNKGRFWKDTKRKIISVDINPEMKTDYCCDNKKMPFSDSYADVLVYDPPHLTDHDTDNSSKVWVERFGLKDTGDNICGEFDLFLREAYRVLKPEGILFAKLADNVHNHKFQWVTVDFVNKCNEIGFMACDCIVKIRKSSMISSKWQKAHHVRRYHCNWIVCRKSNKCE